MVLILNTPQKRVKHKGEATVISAITIVLLCTGTCVKLYKLIDLNDGGKLFVPIQG